MHLLDPAPFGRVLPAMITPMKPNGDVDFDMAQTVAKQLVADGADGLVVNGTTGESPTTHMDEKVELVKAVKEVVDVPVISGAGSNDTAHTVRMVEQTQEAGADAVLVVCPYYSRPSQQGIFCHYQAVNESADKPIIVYDVPGRTGVRIALDTYVHLAELDHVKAVKDATGDIAGAVRKRMETGLTWYSGDDALYLPFLSIGAVGIISVVAHAAAKPMRELAESVRPRRHRQGTGPGEPHRAGHRGDERHRVPGGHGKGGAQGARHHGMHNNASAEHRAERRTDRSRTRRPAGIRSHSGMIRTQRLPKRQPLVFIPGEEPAHAQVHPQYVHTGEEADQREPARRPG
jgi:4-hydroxy-tetrahydrodipicolinate synthase